MRRCPWVLASVAAALLLCTAPVGAQTADAQAFVIRPRAHFRRLCVNRSSTTAAMVTAPDTKLLR